MKFVSYKLYRVWSYNCGKFQWMHVLHFEKIFNKSFQKFKILTNDWTGNNQLQCNYFSGWYHSGDLGYITNDGEIFITDRLKELMKYQNRQVSPTELENFLLSHPGITEVSVVPVPDFEDGERPMAFVVKSPEFQVELSHCRH